MRMLLNQRSGNTTFEKIRTFYGCNSRRTSAQNEDKVMRRALDITKTQLSMTESGPPTKSVELRSRLEREPGMGKFTLAATILASSKFAKPVYFHYKTALTGEIQGFCRLYLERWVESTAYTRFFLHVINVGRLPHRLRSKTRGHHRNFNEQVLHGRIAKRRALACYDVYPSRRALRGSEKAWGPEHTSTLSTVNNLGALYAKLGRLDEAEKMYMRALKGKEKALGAEHASTLAIVRNLSILYAGRGKLDEAEAMYMRALKGKGKALGAEHASTLNTVNRLGLLYWN
jgi:tetratricopeptide (TPR) repeat protein